MFHSIRWRLIFSYMLVTLIAVAVVGTVSYQIIDNYIQGREIDGLRSNAQAIAKQVYPLLWPVIQQGELSRLVKTAAILGDFRVRIFDDQDHLIVDSGSPDTTGPMMILVPFVDQGEIPVFPRDFPAFFWHQNWGEMIRDLEVPAIDGLPPGASITILERSEDPWSGGYIIKDWTTSEELVFDITETATDTTRSSTTIELTISEENRTHGYVELSALPDYGSEVLKQVQKALLFGGGGAVALAGLVGLWISQRLSSPLKKLAQTSAQMEAGNLSVRAKVKSKGEIGDLASQFNQMADRLESSFQQLAQERDSLQRFITDASHELRTPITALKNFNSLLLGNAGDNPQTRLEFLSESQVQIDRLAWITSNLLDLSRLDAGLLPLDFSDHDLREVIVRVAGTFKPLAAKRSIHMNTVVPENPCILSCDQARLELAISNLVDNAIKFSSPGEAIEIGLRAKEGIQIWVKDTGMGISSEDLPHVFDRFYRGRMHSVSGSGLGLSIVKAVVEAHGGQAEIESSLGEGTIVRLSWQ
jgi:signal transduction histidine kinase